MSDPIDHFDFSDTRKEKHFWGIGGITINGVTRFFYDGRPSIFLTDEEIKAEAKVEAERLAAEAQAEAERLAAEAHDLEIATLAVKAKESRIARALSTQFPGFMKIANENAKKARFAKKKALVLLTEIQKTVDELDEALEDYSELGCTARTRTR